MIDFQTANEVFDVYSQYPNGDKTDGYMVGRFMVQDGNLRILEDHQGILKNSLTNGPVGHNAAQLEAMQHSGYLKIVTESDIAQGHHIDLVPKGKEANPLGPKVEEPPDAIEQPDLGDAPQSFQVGEGDNFSMTTPPAVFDYISVGMREPQVIEVRGEEVFMNDHKLNRPQIDRILYNIRTGLGKLKYRKAT
jgi:hypothetical protein